MSLTRTLRLWPIVAIGAALTIVLAVAGSSPSATHGQANPSASPTAVATVGSAAVAASAPGPQPAPAIDNEVAVRALLPAQFSNATTLPGKWARADMPGAPGGYVVFIATIYPMVDGQGNSAYWLLTNYLQWDGTQWVVGLADYRGRKLIGDDLWLAQNLFDITALASLPSDGWNSFSVGYSAQGLVSPTLARSEELVEIYDLSLTTVWSRIDYLQEIDTGNAAYAKTTTQNVDWVFADIDGDGIAELIATVKTDTTITLTGDASPSLPAAGTTSASTTETYKWIDGVYVLVRPPAPAAAPARTPTPAPRASGTPPPGTPTPTRAPATPTPAGTPAG